MSRVFLSAAVLALACGESEPGSSGAGAGSTGGLGAGASGGSSAAGGSGSGSSGAGAGGSGASAGTGDGGDTSADLGGAPGSGGAVDAGGANGTAGAPAELVDCDPRKVTCRIAPPECEPMHVPSVEGNCYGPCVRIDTCGCASAAACPDENEYTCWSQTHCGPYVR